jgi:TonB-dependent SusC/RagA subfamily outer membrane receptor
MTSQIVITYILKTILISGIFLAYYWIALRDKKFHYYNRFYLLTASIMSLVIPLLKFDWFIVEKPVIYSSNEIVQFILPISNVNKSIQYDWVDYSFVIAGIVAITLFSILLLNVIKIQLLKRKSDVTQMEGFDFINTNDDNAPFSFLNNLFWKQSISLQEEGGQQIFKHEITHIQQKHTWDRIYCQIVASIFWMNPFNWVIQKELVTIHEFIADESAVGDSNVEAFAKMLLQTHYGDHFLNPTHQFFYSSIKRRLTMLTKSTNTKYSYLRRVMVLPILIATVCLVSIKVNASEKIEKTAKAIQNTIDLLVNDTTKPKKTTPPTPPNPSTAKPDYYINGAKIAEGAPPPPPLTNPSYYLDGVKINEKEMKDISINGIASINVLKGEQAIKKYREDGKNGVVEIILKDIQRKDQLPNKEWSNINANQNQIKSLEMANGVKIEFKGDIDTAVGNKKTPLYILDGVPLKTAIEVSKLNEEEFESISVLKNPSSISLYGNEGKNGVILITTKTGLKENLQKKSDEIKAFEYSAEEGLNGDVYYKKIGDIIKVTNVPVKVTNVPVKVTNVPVKVTNVPVKVTNVPKSDKITVTSKTSLDTLVFSSPSGSKQVIYSNVTLITKDKQKVLDALEKNANVVITKKADGKTEKYMIVDNQGGKDANKPAFYLDGVKITEKEMKAISPNDIETINVLKGENAIKKYPEDGKSGVVEIKLKQKN